MDAELRGRGPGSPGPDSLADQTFQLLAAGKSQLALERARMALAQHPSHLGLKLALAEASFQEERNDEAQEHARSVLTQDPQNTAAMRVAALVAARMGSFQESEKILLSALKVDPTDPVLLGNYGSIMHRTGRLEKAESLLRRALNFDPENSDLRSMLSVLLSERRELDAASHHGAAALTAAPEDEFPHLASGIAAHQSLRPFAARRHVRTALRQDPTDKQVRELFEEVDESCRWIGLPHYFISSLIARIPGGSLGLHGLFVLSLFLMRSAGVPEMWIGRYALIYLIWAIYSWFARPLTKLWVRMVPAQ